MGRHRRSPAADLRAAVDRLPRATRVAMLTALLEGVPIVTGAFTDRDGGACPLLVAHRRGAPTGTAAFACSWDRFTGVRPGRARRATRHELAVLRAQLEASLVPPSTSLAAAIAEHQALARARRGREAATVGMAWLDEPLTHPGTLERDTA
jgi:hypothetical protein